MWYEETYKGANGAGAVLSGKFDGFLRGEVMSEGDENARGYATYHEISDGL